MKQPQACFAFLRESKRDQRVLGRSTLGICRRCCLSLAVNLFEFVDVEEAGNLLRGRARQSDTVADNYRAAVILQVHDWNARKGRRMSPPVDFGPIRCVGFTPLLRILPDLPELALVVE